MKTYRDRDDSEVVGMDPFTVETTAFMTNVRKQPSATAEAHVEPLKAGRYTVVDVADGEGSSSGWGLLKTFAKNRDGWVNLDVVKRV